MKLKAIVILWMSMWSLASCQTTSTDTVEMVSPSKFGEKFINLHNTIVINSPGVYDYKGVMHVWKGSKMCNIFGADATVMEINSDNVTVKNFGFKDAVAGIKINSEDGIPRKNVTISNVDGHSCYSAIQLPKASINLRLEDSNFIVE